MEIIQRKVTQVGDRLMISLQAEWAKAHGIKKGDSLDVAVTEHGICVLAPGGQNGEQRATVQGINR